MNEAEAITYTADAKVLGSLIFVFVLIAAYRFALLCHKYVTTGEFGPSDEGCLFGIHNHYHRPQFKTLYKKEDIPSFKDAWGYLFAGTHPVTIFSDFFAGFLLSIIISALVAIPALGLIALAIALFILLMKVMRIRYAAKQDFVTKLKGDHLNE
jgi:hypothetical protein